MIIKFSFYVNSSVEYEAISSLCKENLLLENDLLRDYSIHEAMTIATCDSIDTAFSLIEECHKRFPDVYVRASIEAGKDHVASLYLIEGNREVEIFGHFYRLVL